jgi:hypothetical protein
MEVVKIDLFYKIYYNIFVNKRKAGNEVVPQEGPVAA